MSADERDQGAGAAASPGAEKTFLGPEFVTWLFFHLEEEAWNIDLPEAFHDHQNTNVGFALGEKVVLRPIDSAGARVTLAGPDLDSCGEILQAVRRGALVDTLELQCAVSERVYKFTLRAPDGGISGVKLPDLFSAPDDDADGSDPIDPLDPLERKKAAPKPKIGIDELLSVRMSCLEEIEAIVDALFQRFVTRRVARAWVTEDVRAMRKKVAIGLKRSLPAAP